MLYELRPALLTPAERSFAGVLDCSLPEGVIWFAKVRLADVFKTRRPVTSFNNSDRRLVTVFLWQQGKLERFLRLIAARDRAGFRSCFEAAMGKPLKEVEPLWQAYLAEIVAHRAEVMRVPGSTVLPNLTVYQRAVAGSPPWRYTQAPR